MNRARKERGPIRGSFTRTVNEIRAELNKAEPDQRIINLKFEKLERLHEDIVELDAEMRRLMLEDENITDEQYEQEVAVMEQYVDTMRDIASLVNIQDVPVQRNRRPASPTRNDDSISVESYQKKISHLAPLKIKSFNGELTEWISFWSQFKKIHEDERMHESDKFQYLVQSMVKGTRAESLVNSYPQSEENYPKVIKALKERFGKEDLLVEVYVRELLKLVIWNTSERREKVPLATLYDKVEAHLRALETMGVTTDKNAAMLYPLVESSLPEDVMRAWQRSSLSSSGENNGQKTRLERLMEFLKLEIEGDERIALARAGFGNPTKSVKQVEKSRNRRDEDFEELPTAAGLLNGNNANCIFCERNHDSKNCIKAQTISLQRRKEIVQKKKRCFQCFRAGHFSKNCKVFVRCIACGGKHQTLLCSEISTKNGQSSESNEEVQNLMTGTTLTCTKSVIMKTLLVKLINGDKTKIIRALIDDGSQKSYLLKKTAMELGIESDETELLNHALFGGITSGAQEHKILKVQIGHPTQNFTKDVQILEASDICVQIPRMNKGPWMKELKKKKIWLSDVGEGSPKIEMMIGLTIIGKLLTGRIHQLSNGLTAQETHIGWVVMGPLKEDRSTTTSAMLVSSNLVAEASVCELWNLETIGITDPTERLSQIEKDEVTRQQFLRTVSRNQDGRYSVSLPWIEGHPPLPMNKEVAVKRLWNATNKLNSTNNFSRYEDVFNEWLSMGVIEEVTEEGNNCHYLPHRPVIKEESRTTKVRPVFDASCKSKNTPSLNECLQKGPSSIEMIPTVLLRFRENKIGVISDIRKAFLMIEINEEDRNFLRFLWWENFQNKKIKIYRHCRVLFGLNCSPFLLSAVIQHHLSLVPEDKKPLTKKLLECLYVDNLVTSVDTREELDILVKESTAILAGAQLDLRMWEDSLGVNGTENEISPVLGLQWNKKEDYLYVDIQKESRRVIPEVLTKRSILSFAQKIFDPVGFLSPVLLIPKLLLQESWLKKLSWDDEVPTDLKKRFTDWVESLDECGKVKIPRHLSIGNKCNFSLHVFSDASKHAYAAVIFLRSEENGRVQLRLVQSKSRVAPVKNMTIPRLELLSCVIGVRLTDTIKSGLKYEDVETIYWSDSTTAIAWITRNDQWGTFVGNRTKEIRSKTEANHWKHVPGKMNPADLPSRGCSAIQLAQSSWWEGPSWLLKSKEYWPSQQYSINEEEVAKELKKCVSTGLRIQKGQQWFERISSYSKIIRVAAWMKRFINWKIRGVEPLSKELTSEEIQEAELGILRVVQEEFRTQKNTYGLKTFEDESGLLRVKTKLLYRDDFNLFVSPILLPPQHHVVSSLIREVHLQNCHGGVQFLMSKLREKYWIVKSRRSIRSILGRCIKCRRFDAKKLESLESPLPKERVQNSAVFEVTGIDLAGPLYLKEEGKVWIVLFTCAVYRAVHLELVSSLSTEGFIQALRRFIARRGRPKVVFSDNGTNFHGTNNGLKELDWYKIQSKFGTEVIEWKFIPPSAAWWGGFWERLIRSIKSLLLRILGNSVLNFEELMTVLCDVESTINERPLTYVSDEHGDLVPLTPMMFLRDLRVGNTADIDELDRDGFNKRFRYRQKIRDEFRSRFRKEYLGQLVQRSKERKLVPVRVGDIVFVGYDNKNRIDWPIARVVEILPGKDGAVRVVKVKTADGILTRPVQRIFPSEVSDKELGVNSQDD